MPFYPGPGIGGHCIPLDPHYLSWKARQHGFDSRFISLAEEVNSRMPEHVVQLVSDGLNDERKAMKGSRILAAGRRLQERHRRRARESGAFDHRSAARERRDVQLSRSVRAGSPFR